MIIIKDPREEKEIKFSELSEGEFFLYRPDDSYEQVYLKITFDASDDDEEEVKGRINSVNIENGTVDFFYSDTEVIKIDLNATIVY